jgi:hypothetical protein
MCSPFALACANLGLLPLVTQGLSGAASALIQLGALVLHYYQKWYAGRTPRQAYKATFVMPSADFGVLLPRISLLATIGLAYSVISPVINGLAVVSFFLFFLAWKFCTCLRLDRGKVTDRGNAQCSSMYSTSRTKWRQAGCTSPLQSATFVSRPPPSCACVD